jgi:hypothetical protein
VLKRAERLEVRGMAWFKALYLEVIEGWEFVRVITTIKIPSHFNDCAIQTRTLLAGRTRSVPCQSW